MKPKRIAVNTRLLLSDRLEGIGRFTHEIFQRLTPAMPDHEFYFLFDRPFDPKFVYSDNVHPIVVSPPTRHPVLWKIWFDYQLPRMFKKHGIDLFISPDGFLSQRTRTPQIAVIHDLNFIRKPKNLRPSHRTYYLQNFPRFAEISNPLVTVSEYSKTDLIEQFGLSAEKIEVIYNGVSEHFYPPEADSDERLLEDFPYFLFVGAFNPRKNISGLLKAFEAFKSEGGQAHLCLVGEEMFMDQEMRNVLNSMNHRADVHFFGRASDDQLRLLYGHARALVLPSFEEGFGIPIIEAMRCGTAVICSRRSAMPEVAGEAALFIEPDDTAGIAAALHRVDSDKSLRDELVRKGAERAEQFRWTHSAEGFKQLIRAKLSEV
jgi:glycosyltransferase involved in cell wall biosynthesis